MKYFRAVIGFLGDLLVPTSGLSSQVRNYCRQEGVDPGMLLEQNRHAWKRPRAKEPQRRETAPLEPRRAVSGRCQPADQAGQNR